MRNTAVLPLALLALPALASAQQSALHKPAISANGAWVAAEERSDRGSGNVRVWSTKGDVTFTIERGQNPRFSRDSRWVSALSKGQELVLLDTRDGSRRTFESVVSYEVTRFSSHLVYLQSSGTLRVAELVSDRVFTWENVTRFAAHQATDLGPGEEWKKNYAYVAFVTRNERTGDNKLEVAFLGHEKRGWGTGGTYEGEKIGDLCWAHDSVTLGFVDSSAVYTWHDVRGRSGHRKFTRVNTR